MRELAVSLASGALTGAITGGLGAKLASAFPKAAKVVEKIPLADWVKVGLFNTGDGILGRFVYAVADGNMSVEEKFAYAFSPEHMAMDFVGGAAMYGMSKAVPKVREKLPWNKISNEGGTGVGNIAGKLDTNNIPNMTKQDIIDNIPDDWNYTEHNGFVHIRDADGNIRIRIDPPDKITNYPHVHAYDSDGNLLDSAGNIVDRKSPDGHIPYKDK